MIDTMLSLEKEAELSRKENFYLKVEVNQLKSQNYSLLNEINNLRNKITLF